MSERHVVIVGGGVIGVACAYYLALRGARVTLLERERLGCGASGGNAGTVAPGHGPINKPGRVMQALRSLFDPLSALYVAPRIDPALARWLWTFRKHCTAEHFDRALAALAPLGHESVRQFDRVIDEERLDCDYRKSGYFEVYRNGAALEKGVREAELAGKYGFAPQVLDGPALREREPAIGADVLGGIFFPEARTMDPQRFVDGLAAAAVRHGASVRIGASVFDVPLSGGRATGVRTSEGEQVSADAVILAAGAYCGPLFRRVGWRLPLQAAKGYHRDRSPADGATPALTQAVMLGETSVFCTPMAGGVRFAGTLEFSGVNHDIRQPRLEQLTNAARLYLDGLGEAPSRSEWCGLRPCLPDGLPAIGAVPGKPGLFVATGHAMLGLTLAPATGKLMSELVLDGRTSIDISAFAPGRFR